MKGDFSRLTFDPRKHFRGVLEQQGRVHLDADWNENLDILLHRIETETIDVIGQCGVPIHEAAFSVVTDISTLSQEEQDLLTDLGFNSLQSGDFYLTKGRAYVDGILVENDSTLPFTQQPFILPHGEGMLTETGNYLLYLDVWQRHITALEDPSIREVALGGPDTATRVQTIWQAVLAKVGEMSDVVACSDDISPWPAPSKGKLSARTHPEVKPDDPCTIPPGAGYKRLENQLYRVEIHKDSDASGGPTFKWSRDNGSVVVAIAEFAVDGVNQKIRTTSLGRDDVLGLHENDWVEVLDDATELAGKPGTLAKITKIDPDNILTLSLAVIGYDINGHPKVRRWDSSGEIAVSVPNDNDGYLELEGDIEIKFEIDTFHSGDYWLIPARTVPGQFGDIEWPKQNGNPVMRLPFGILHHYCKLAILTFDGKVITGIEDCRNKFPPLTELPIGGESCCSVTVGEGGDYTDIQTAIDARPADATFWNVCVLPGEHKLEGPLIVSGQDGFSLSGCNNQTLITGPAGKPILAAQYVKTLQIEGLIIKASSDLGAFLIADCQDVTISGCRGESILPDGLAASPVVVALDCDQVNVHNNRFLGQPVLVARGEFFEINDNFFTGGGVQVLFGSMRVRIDRNRILNGGGPGIQLGGTFDEDKVEAFLKKVDSSSKEGDISGETKSYSMQLAIDQSVGVFISNNFIGGMLGSGILTLDEAFNQQELGEVSHLLIEHNQIVSCANEPDLLLADDNKLGGGINLSSVSDVTIHGNLIAGNAREGKDRRAACGILITNAANVDIIDNVVVQNGTDAGEISNGYQAGIAALYIFGNDLTPMEVFGGNISDMNRGMPALTVRGNKVVMPAGQALNALVAGTTQVTDNIFVTQGRLEQKEPLPGVSSLGVCVQILNFGYQGWLASMLGGAEAGTHFEIAEGGIVPTTPKDIPDGRIMFNDNQTNLIFSEREEDKTPRFTPTSIALFSLDDISFQGNQSQADTTPGFLLANVVVWGTTIRASDNHFNEPVMSTVFSYSSQATLMNTTNANTSIHCIYTTAPQRIEKDNLILLNALCEQLYKYLPTP